MLSKRTILSQVAWIYDPIGFASAFLIRAKIGLQELWEKGVGWDEKLPFETQEKWTNLFQEMKSLNGTSFERCLTPPYAVGRPVLCVFFLMPLKTHSVPAHMHDGRCRMESTTHDLLQQNQGLHRWKDWPYLAWSFKVQSWPPDCVRPL